MCGRFVQHSDPEIYARQFDLNTVCESAPRYNVAPTQSVLAIRERDQGKRELVPLRWGLVPFWSKGPDSRYSMINARAETVGAKPAYRDAFKRRRCLIPAEGFYEWRTDEGAKTPFLIQRADRRPFAMAGLWERWRQEDGELLESCTIIVTDANSLVRDIHDRMPVILNEGDIGAWLDPENDDAEELLAMLKPADPAALAMHEVSRQVNSPRNDGPELLEAVDGTRG
ncbi:MAG: SOS response-associated peptidase [Thiohalocapsa sp.]|jgi:putative SOS response-associated peptidase YedK